MLGRAPEKRVLWRDACFECCCSCFITAINCQLLWIVRMAWLCATFYTYVCHAIIAVAFIPLWTKLFCDTFLLLNMNMHRVIRCTYTSIRTTHRIHFEDERFNFTVHTIPSSAHTIQMTWISWCFWSYLNGSSWPNANHNEIMCVRLSLSVSQPLNLVTKCCAVVVVVCARVHGTFAKIFNFI